MRARAKEMRCVGSKRTPELGRDMLLAASIVKFSGAFAPGGNRTVYIKMKLYTPVIIYNI